MYWKNNTKNGETRLYQQAGMLEHSQLPYPDSRQVVGNVDHLRWNLSNTFHEELSM